MCLQLVTVGTILYNNINLNQITKETDNFTANDFIILCCGSNDTDNVKLNMVLKNFIDFIKSHMD
jgi:hypothetical protein